MLFSLIGLSKIFKLLIAFNSGFCRADFGLKLFIYILQTEDKGEESREIEEIRIEKEKDHLENLDKSFFRKSFPSSAQSDEIFEFHYYI
ncbi:hypothetical protein Avbf_12316 [Armadillidium vulgare]|nr:hypothetical protein Avbf_12316 [Armadillidium vulgare]